MSDLPDDSGRPSSREFFVFANSFAAPFFSDDHTEHVLGDSAEDALMKFVASYTHPAGLYAAMIYDSADAYHKGAKPLAKWLCNHELGKRKVASSKGGYSYLGHGPGDFEIDGVRVKIADPKGGKVVPVE